jgi:hypothetical protein
MIDIVLMISDTFRRRCVVRCNQKNKKNKKKIEQNTIDCFLYFEDEFAFQ